MCKWTRVSATTIAWNVWYGNEYILRWIKAKALHQGSKISKVVRTGADESMPSLKEHTRARTHAHTYARARTYARTNAHPHSHLHARLDVSRQLEARNRDLNIELLRNHHDPHPVTSRSTIQPWPLK